MISTKSLMVCTAILVFNTFTLFSKSIYQRQISNHEIEIEFDMYYSNIDYYIPLTKKNIECLKEEDEFDVYKTLLLCPVPKFLVIELSVNPMPCLGVYFKKNYQDQYNRSTIGNNFNYIKGICAGFEEPYAGSVFLGNVVSFKPEKTEGQEGKGYIGALISGGSYHIKDNELIEDNWLEGEVKIKGDKTTQIKKMSWSFRVGTKLHGNRNIKDVMYFSLRRDRVDVNYYGLSFFKNSGYEYTFDISKEDSKIIRHNFRVSKKVPLRNSKIAFSIDTGFIWEGEEKYTGILARESKNGDFQIVFQPNFQF